jgi:MYXO-CTERM domain-containing protein
MKFRSLFAVVALVVSSHAMAVTQDLGTLTSSGSGFSQGFVRFFGLGSDLGTFTDYYTFNIGNANVAAGGTLSFDFGFVDLTLNSVSLFATGNPGAATLDPTPGAFTFSNLIANTSYTLAVTGTLLSNQWLDIGAAYYEGSIRSVASAAPEPSALMLALAGLAGVLTLARRRRVR